MSVKRYSDEERAKFRALGYSDAAIDEHEDHERQREEAYAEQERLLREAGFAEGMIRSIIEQRKETERLGLTPEAVERMLDEVDCLYRADELLPKLLEKMMLRVHSRDGWRARRRLKRLIRGKGANRHLAECGMCRLQLGILTKKLHLLGEAITPPPAP